MFRYNIATAAVFAALSIYVMIGASNLQPGGMAKFGPGYWPFFLGTALLLLSAGLLLETIGRRFLEKKRADAAGAPLAPEKPIFDFASPGLICIYKLCGLLLGFVLLLHYANFIVATLLFAPSCMWLLGVRKLSLLASVTAGLPLSVYFVFTYLLRIRLP